MKTIAIARRALVCFTLAVMSARSAPERPVIYQLFVRTFGNANETRKQNGTLAENGCGKFSDIGVKAIGEIRKMGFTHVWLTGVLEQASGTAYPNRPADDPNILKGIAGSPYAIKDYFDVCPDYAVDPNTRIDEFKALLARCEKGGLKVIIDFVPNHVARSYASDVKPSLSFGEGDDRAAFFSRDNHFYYLRRSDPGEGPPLKLPTAGKPGCNGLFAPETEYGRVTGNNVVSWSPGNGDWYETVKLNYGHDFTSGRDTSSLPGPDAEPTTVPKTWRTMDEIIRYWQEMGVDGFRVDMAHMVPMPFWKWMVKRAHDRKGDVFFMAEAYDNDPAKLTEGHVLDELLKAGFDAVYDDPVYDVLEGLYDSGKWANDLDALTFTSDRFHQSLRYAENHDEVRLANPQHWGGLGMKVGRPVSAVLFAMGKGPVMLYNGQEVGEPAIGSEGFGGDDGRSSIFDYGSMPEFNKWTNRGKFDGGRLSPEQKELRAWYAELLGELKNPAFTKGEFYGLNHANNSNPAFGRIHGETASGHWLYAFLRRDPESKQAYLVVANFHGSESLKGVRLKIPDDARKWLMRESQDDWVFDSRFHSDWTGLIKAPELSSEGLLLPELAPCSAWLIEIR